MQNHISHMLDSMIIAVDEGHSYDGIVSMPEIGLEDADYQDRPNPLINGVESLQTAFSQVVAGFSRQATHEERVGVRIHPSDQVRFESESGKQTSNPGKILPSRKPEEVLVPMGDTQGQQPRKLEGRGRADDQNARDPDQGQQPRKRKEEEEANDQNARDPTDLDQDQQPRKRGGEEEEEEEADDQNARDPRKRM